MERRASSRHRHRDWLDSPQRRAFWCQRHWGDIADSLLNAARDLSSHIEPPIDYRHADAEDLPFDDKEYDAVISTFGLMFAPNQEAVAGEVARVCKPGGRLVIAAWTPAEES